MIAHREDAQRRSPERPAAPKTHHLSKLGLQMIEQCFGVGGRQVMGPENVDIELSENRIHEAFADFRRNIGVVLERVVLTIDEKEIVRLLAVFHLHRIDVRKLGSDRSFEETPALPGLFGRALGHLWPGLDRRAYAVE